MENYESLLPLILGIDNKPKLNVLYVFCCSF